MSREEEGIHKRDQRLVAQVGDKRLAARMGDANAQAWVAGLELWFRAVERGQIPSALVDEPASDRFADLTEEQGRHFKRGYQHAVDMNAAGFESEALSYLKEWGDDGGS